VPHSLITERMDVRMRTVKTRKEKLGTRKGTLRKGEQKNKQKLRRNFEKKNKFRHRGGTLAQGLNAYPSPSTFTVHALIHNIFLEIPRLEGDFPFKFPVRHKRFKYRSCPLVFLVVHV
jgi:hypothetical protein